VLCLGVVVPIGQVLGNDPVAEILISTGCLTFGIVHSSAQIAVLRRGMGRSWLGFVSSLSDVVFVTLALIAILAVSGPLAVANNKVLFSAYFVVIASTCFRFDPRICVAVGALAALSYAGLLVYVHAAFDLRAPEHLPAVHGQLKLSAQIGRIVLLGSAAGLAAATVIQMRRLALLSTRDPLTGLVNRRFLDERIHEACGHWERDPVSIALVLIDVDHFKQFNDRYGHAAGDQALRTLSGVLRESFRASDTIARFGGEEFAVFMEGASHAVIRERCDRLLATLSVTPIPHTDGGTIAVSAGVAIGPDDGRSPMDLMRAADRRLYQAKWDGRGRVRHATPQPSFAPA